MISRRPKTLPVLEWLLAGMFLLLVLGPIAALLSNAHELVGLDWLALIIPQGRRWNLWWQSVSLAAAVAVTGMSLGILIALRLTELRYGPATLTRWLFLILIPIPPFIHAMAWSSLVFRLNSWLRPANLAQIPFRGWSASWWVQTLSLLPIAVALALVALESVDPELIEAGRLLRPDQSTLRQVILPLAAPTLLAGSGLLFLFSLVDYAIPSLFQLQVYALEIFADFGAHNQVGRALLISVPLLAVTVAAVIYSQAKLGPAALNPSQRGSAVAGRYRWSAWFGWLQKLALAVMLLQAAVPLLSLLLLTGSWSTLRQSVAAASSELGFSLLVALLAALFCLPVAYGMAHKTLAGGRWRWLWWLAMALPLAVPGPLVGIGLISLWNQPTKLSIYGSAWMPVLAALARFTPLATIILLAALRRQNPALLEAARILPTAGWRTWLLVQLPMLAPGLLAAAGLVFCLTLGELSATLLVAPPGQATLAMRIYNFLHYGATDTVAGLCLVLTAPVLLLGALALLLLLGWSRLSTMPGENHTRDDFA